MKKLQFILVCLIAFFPQIGKSQVNFTTNADRLSISVNEMIQVQFMVENAEIEKFDPPAFVGFKVIQGPYESSGMSLINSKLTQYKAVIYLLQPQKTGRLTIQGATAMINGKSMRSNNIVIDVTKGAGKQPPSSPGPMDNFNQEPEDDYQLAPRENAVEKIKKNLFVKLEVDKTSVYVGEPIVAEYKLYTRLRSESRVSKRPSLNGFSVYDMLDPSAPGSSTETIQGQQYQVHTIRKTQLFPLQEGSFLLEPVEVENKVRFLRVNGSSTSPKNTSPLERMFEDLLSEQNGEWEEYNLTVTSKSMPITVKALPANAPAGFDGAVGSFQVHGKLLNNSIPADETGTYELVIEGSGNIPLVNEPTFNLPVGLHLFEPELSEEINKEQAPMTGIKKIKYNFSSSNQGQYLLPSLTFCYFDPAQKEYKSITTDSLKLMVTAPLTKRKSSDAIINDNNSKVPWWGWVIGGSALLLGGILTGLAVSKRKRSIVKITVQVPPVLTEPTVEETLPIKIDPLNAARKAYSEGNNKAYYQSIEKALWDIISERLALNSSAQQKSLALEKLSKKGMSQDHLQYLKDCWGQSEWALYVPVSEADLDGTLLNKASTVINAIENLPVG